MASSPVPASFRVPARRPSGRSVVSRSTSTGEEAIYSLVRQLLTDQAEYQRMSRASNPYGDGKASARIADAIAARFAGQKES